MFFLYPEEFMGAIFKDGQPVFPDHGAFPDDRRDLHIRRVSRDLCPFESDNLHQCCEGSLRGFEEKSLGSRGEYEESPCFAGR